MATETLALLNPPTTLERMNHPKLVSAVDHICKGQNYLKIVSALFFYFTIVCYVCIL
jgi:hypothetical protein